MQDHAALLMEQRADSLEELEHKVRSGAQLAEGLSLSAPFEMTTEAARRAALWTTRKGLYAAVAEPRPTGTTALLEDVVVAVAWGGGDGLRRSWPPGAAGRDPPSRTFGDNGTSIGA